VARGDICSSNLSGAIPSNTRTSLIIRATAMAEVSYTDGITPPKENVGPGETTPQTNPSMIEEVEERTTATTGIDAISPQMPATQASTEEMPAPEAFAPRDLAMESNLMTTAEAPSIEHGTSNTVPSAAGVAAEHSTASVTAAGAETSSGYAVPLVPAAGVETPSKHSDTHGHATELPHQWDTSATRVAGTSGRDPYLEDHIRWYAPAFCLCLPHS